jgi:hypothetical protein
MTMGSGGARNRSGPSLDPLSGRSEQRGIKLTQLPAEGYVGPVPEFPLPELALYTELLGDEGKLRVFDPDATAARREREQDLWSSIWATPQACAWARERWRWHAVAMWVRTSALCESSDATAADKNSLHRFADQVGLTPAGLRENGWTIAADTVGEKRAEHRQTAAKSAPARRLRAVDGSA